ncbi:Neural cell adhesion molecule L1.1 (Fragment) [Geodia barretti]|uniref:Neural cell adhesion molecule L1.1 n=1 Tax=Geodia barretti TaxID=519541 RepID=A0AA35WQX8_GEOBA
MNISLGSTVVLICEVTIDPSYDVVESANVNWVGPRLSSSREGFTITQSTSGLSCYTSRLTISEVVGEDAGDYSCGLSSIGGNQYVVTTSTTSFIPLRVFDPPPMLVLSSSIPQGEVARGSSVVLTCVATFSSQLDSVKLTWGGPQTISTSDESKHKIVEANSGLTYSNSLTVLDVKGQDEGVYVCTLSGVDKNGLQVTSDSSIAISVAEPSNSGAGIQRSGLSLIITGIIALFLFA